MGARCDRCHDTGSWKEASFGPEAHRRTNFPLIGRHAVIPCEQCHGDRRDRAFARPTTLCIACHQADYDRTATASVPHAGTFPTDCRGCHSTWRFSPGTWAAHDACFQITVGPARRDRLQEVPLGRAAAHPGRAAHLHRHAGRQLHGLPQPGRAPRACPGFVAVEPALLRVSPLLDRHAAAGAAGQEEPDEAPARLLPVAGAARRRLRQLGEVRARPHHARRRRPHRPLLPHRAPATPTARAVGQASADCNGCHYDKAPRPRRPPPSTSSPAPTATSCCAAASTTTTRRPSSRPGTRPPG